MEINRKTRFFTVFLRGVGGDAVRDHLIGPLRGRVWTGVGWGGQSKITQPD